MIGIYLHVPFCLRKCPYCDFYSLPYSDHLADAYTDALIRAVRCHPYGNLRADTVYFGGGTPLLLGAARLSRVLGAAVDAFGVGSRSEITLEVNPAAVTPHDLASLRQAGFNRLSVGVQSLCDGELNALGRLHTARDAEQTIRDAAAAGFTDISADLMLAVPGQTGESLRATVRGLCDLPITHLSAYLLKIEEGTPFHAKKSALNAADDDESADLYLECVRQLAQRGLAQYEISNFAREGRVSRHNLKYWQCEPYLGIGPAAHSFLGGRRFFFPRDLSAFLGAERPFDRTVFDGQGGDPAEQLLLRLRLTQGVSPAEHLPSESADRLLQEARRLASRGLVRIADGRVSLTPEGFLLSNTVIAALLDAAGPPC